MSKSPEMKPEYGSWNYWINRMQELEKELSEARTNIHFIELRLRECNTELKKLSAYDNFRSPQEESR